MWNSAYVGDPCKHHYFPASPGKIFVYDSPDGQPRPTFRFPRNATLPSGLVTNDFGWRGPPVPFKRTAKTVRIVFLGASTMAEIHNFPFSSPEYVHHWLNLWAEQRKLDPASAALNGMLGLLHYIDARFGWWDDRQPAHGKARAYTDRALELDPENPDAYTASSLVMLLEGRYDEAALHARKATQIAPGSADAATCFVLAFAGYAKEAVAHGERAMTLSPHYPAHYLGQLGNAYRLAGRVEEATTAFKAYNARNPGFGLTDMVIAYQQTNRPEEAKATAQQLLSIRRDFTTAAWANTQFFRADKAQLEADIAALHAAGLLGGPSGLILDHSSANDRPFHAA